MKIAVTSTGQTLEAAIDSRFGRCPYYMLVDSETLEQSAMENPNQNIGGAGIQSAQLLLDMDVQVVITGSCGPNAFQILQTADVPVYLASECTVQEAVQQFKDGNLSAAASHNAESHSGMRTGSGGGARQ